MFQGWRTGLQIRLAGFDSLGVCYDYFAGYSCDIRFNVIGDLHATAVIRD